jgi:hypothetical protein
MKNKMAFFGNWNEEHVSQCYDNAQIGNYESTL